MNARIINCHQTIFLEMHQCALFNSELLTHHIVKKKNHISVNCYHKKLLQMQQCAMAFQPEMTFWLETDFRPEMAIWQ